MTEVGEGVALPEVTPDKCPICEKAPHPDRTTTDKKEGRGCLDSKPKNLGCSQIIQDPLLPNYATAAHHIIPAIQCLKRFPRLSQMCESVGYDVNNSKNGMPLPTCGQRSLNSYQNSSGGHVKFGRLVDEDKDDVAYLIMEGLDMQWHVGHHDWKIDYETDGEIHPENYDKLVKTKLRDLEKDAQRGGDSICEPPDESESGSALISEMNALSAEIEAQVKAWSSYFVSARACTFAAKYRN